MFGFFALSEYPFSTITRDGYAYASFPQIAATTPTGAGSGDANVYVTLYSEVIIAPTVLATGGATAEASIGTLTLTVPTVLAYQFKFTPVERTLSILKENRLSLISKDSRIIYPIDDRMLDIESESRFFYVHLENRTLEIMNG